MAPIVLSIFHPLWVAYFIIAFDLYWFLKAMRQSYFLVIGYRKLYKEERVDWAGRLKWLARPEFYLKATERQLAAMVSEHPQLSNRFGRAKPALRQRYQGLLEQLTMQRDIVAREAATIKPDELYHAIIVAVYNESRDILEPTVESLAATDYNGQRLILMIACEERGGAQVKADCEDLIKQYGHKFAAAEVVMHPDGVPGEVRGKGPNITQAGRRLQQRQRSGGSIRSILWLPRSTATIGLAQVTSLTLALPTLWIPTVVGARSSRFRSLITTFGMPQRQCG